MDASVSIRIPCLRIAELRETIATELASIAIVLWMENDSIAILRGKYPSDGTAEQWQLAEFEPATTRAVMPRLRC